MRLPTVWPATAATLLVMCLEPVPKLPADLAETEERYRVQVAELERGLLVVKLRDEALTEESIAGLHFVFDVDLRTEDPPARWILRGVCLLTTKD